LSQSPSRSGPRPVLAAEGLVKTDTPEDADIILFNTCSVREKAQEKVFSELGRARELKSSRRPYGPQIQGAGGVSARCTSC